MPLPFLRKFNLPALSFGGNTYDVNSHAAMGATPERLYVCGYRGGLGLNSRLFVFDWQGNRVTDEEFALPATTRTLGIFVRGGTLYRMHKEASVFTQRYPITEYTLSGVAGSTRYFNLNNHAPDYNDHIGAFVISGGNCIVLYIDVTVNDWFFYTAYYPALTPTPNPSKYVSYLNATQARSMALRPNGFFLTGDALKILALDSNLDRDTENDITSASPNLLTHIGSGLADYGNGVAVLNWTGSVYEVHLYGNEPPIRPELGVHQQYDGFSDYEERFDIVSVDANDNITTHKATDIKALRRTDASRFSVATTVPIGTQLSVISFVPRFTIPDAEINDVLFVHTGAIGVHPTALGSPRYKIEGFEQAGANIKQVFVARLITE